MHWSNLALLDTVGHVLLTASVFAASEPFVTCVASREREKNARQWDERRIVSIVNKGLDLTYYRHFKKPFFFCLLRNCCQMSYGLANSSMHTLAHRPLSTLSLSMAMLLANSRVLLLRAGILALIQDGQVGIVRVLFKVSHHSRLSSRRRKLTIRPCVVKQMSVINRSSKSKLILSLTTTRKISIFSSFGGSG